MTTERIFPAVARPVPAHAHPASRTRAEAPARATVKRKEALLTTPARAGMLIGASAAIYAVSLAGVAALQSQANAELAAHRQPWLDQVAQTRAANDALQAALVKADADLQVLGTTYSQAGASVTAYDQSLNSLAALVAEVQGTAAAMPKSFSLPSVSIHGSVGSAAAPRTSATTSASAKP
jgi:multidrug efflux pump subunit AcrA (membrane-fusion protein)